MTSGTRGKRRLKRQSATKMRMALEAVIEQCRSRLGYCVVCRGSLNYITKQGPGDGHNPDCVLAPYEPGT